MRILHTVEFYAPAVGGAQEAVRQISEHLVRFGHEVTVATSSLPERTFTELRGVSIWGSDLSGNLARGMKGDIAGYRRFVMESGFDLVMSYAAQQWATDALLEVLSQIRSRKVLVPCGFSGLRDPLYRSYFARMPGWLREYDATVYLGEVCRDAQFARAHGFRDLHVIPNGAGEDEFRQTPCDCIRARLGISPDSFLILHVGSHTGLKGHAEAVAIFHGARIGNATLVIVANTLGGGGCSRACHRAAFLAGWRPMHRLAGKQVKVLALSRLDTVALYHAADCFLFPSNIECSPIVLFEAAASGTPFLASDAGNSAEIAAWTGAGEIMETRHDEAGLCWPSVDDGARRLERLWSDAPRRRMLAQAGRRAWEERFTWAGVARRYEALYLRLLGWG